jgi:hypothetical protein
VRNWIRQFALIVATLLLLGNGGSAFAGVISLSEVVVESSPAILDFAIPSHHLAGVLQDDSGSEMDRPVSPTPPPGSQESAPLLDNSSSLLGTLRGVAQVKMVLGHTADVHGLGAEENPGPGTPQPATPSGGEAGAAPSALTTGGKDRPVGFPTESAARDQDRESTDSNPCLVGSILDPSAAGLFRPPREQC